MSYLVVYTKTAAQFTADNPILLPNQIGMESDTLITKVGDGLTAWNSLDYDTPAKGAFEQVLSGLTYKVPSSYAVQQAIASAGTPTLAQVLAAGNDATDQSILNLQAVHNADGTRDTWVYADATLAKQVYLYGSNSAPINGGDYFSILGNTTTVDDPLVSLSVYSGASIAQTTFLLKKAQVLLTGSYTTFAGMVYAADYSANYTIRSLIDKGYAAATFAPISVVGSVTSVAWTTSQGVSASIANATTTPNITITLGALTGVTSLNGLVVTANTGVITTGTWNASLIGLAYGGTNKNMTAVNGGVVWTDADSMEVSAAGSSGQILQSNGAAAPTWSTATYPATATGTGTILRADGTNWVATTATYPNTITSGYIPYAAAANVIGSSANFQHDGTTVFIGGSSTAISSEILSVQKNQNALTQMYVSNTTSGTAAGSSIVVTDGAVGNVQELLSAGFTTSGIRVANTGAFRSSATGGMNIGTSSTSQLSFWTTDTKRASFLSSGELIWGGTTLIATEKVSIQNNANAITQFIVSNTTSGTAARAVSSVLTASSLGVSIHAISASYTTSNILVANTGVISCSSGAGLNVGTTSNTQLSFWTNNTKKVSIPAAGGLVVGTAALATTATDGFLYIPTCAGTPTGVPTAQTGTVAMVFDTTNNKLYIYDGGWLGGTTPGAFT